MLKQDGKIMSLRQRNKRRNKLPEKPINNKFSGCHACGNENTSRSPTGDWCNNCGMQWPCPCVANDHKECFEHLLKKSTENNLTTPRSCCCGEFKEQAK